MMAGQVELKIEGCRQAIEERHMALPLDLKRHKLVEVPPALLDLRHLTCLYLEGNRLTSLPEDFFLRLPHVRWLDLRSNLLTALPTAARAYRQSDLQHLLLEGNNLTRLPNELGEVTCLQGLSLSRNPLDYPPSDVIAEGVRVIIAFLREALHPPVEKPASTHTMEDERGDHGAEGHRRPRVSMMSSPLRQNHHLMLSSDPSQDPNIGMLGSQSEVDHTPMNNELLRQYHQQQQREEVRHHEQMPGRPQKQHKQLSKQQTPRGGSDSTMPHKQAVMGRARPVGAGNLTTSPQAKPQCLLEEANERKRRQQQQQVMLRCRRDVDTLSDWRDDRKREQRMLQYTATRQGTAALPTAPVKPAPYATEDNSADKKLASSVKHLMGEASTLLEGIVAQEDREKQLRERIQQHIGRMKRDRPPILSPKSQVEAAQRDYEEALENRQLVQASVEKEREYRLSAAFVASLDQNKDKESSEK